MAGEGLVISIHWISWTCKGSLWSLCYLSKNSWSFFYSNFLDIHLSFLTVHKDPKSIKNQTLLHVVHQYYHYLLKKRMTFLRSKPDLFYSCRLDPVYLLNVESGLFSKVECDFYGRTRNPLYNLLYLLYNFRPNSKKSCYTLFLS